MEIHHKALKRRSCDFFFRLQRFSKEYIIDFLNVYFIKGKYFSKSAKISVSKWGKNINGVLFEETKIPINADSFPCPRVVSNNKKIKNKRNRKEKPSNESESNGEY